MEYCLRQPLVDINLTNLGLKPKKPKPSCRVQTLPMGLEARRVRRIAGVVAAALRLLE